MTRGFFLTLALCILVLAPRNHYAFTPVHSTHLETKTTTRKSLSSLQVDVSGRNVDIDSVMDEMEAALRAADEALASPPPPPKPKEEDFDIDGLLGDAEAALQAAEEVLQQPKPKAVQEALLKQQQTPKKPMNYMTKRRISRPLIPDQDITVDQLLQAPPEEPAVNVPAVASQSRTPSEEQEILASTLGGIVTGIVLGVAVFEVIPDLDMYVDYSIPPIIASFVFGIAYYTSASIEGSNGAIVRSIVGKPMQVIGNGILDTIAAIGNSMTSAAQRQVEKTTNNIKSIPGRAADNIKGLPGRAADAASRKATEVVQDIKSTPGRVANDTKRKVVETVDSVKKRVDNVLPKYNNRDEEE
jgi:hypothetical protein